MITSREHDEEIMLRDFQNAARGYGDVDSCHSVTVTVFDGAGNVLGSYEERLYGEDR